MLSRCGMIMRLRPCVRTRNLSTSNMPAPVKLRKAVFPVAGFGTRFLPATKVNPKEMLPVIDKPLIQYATEEAIAAGIDTLIFVNGKHKRAIEDHFDVVPELAWQLRERGKDELLAQVENIVPPGVTCINMRQPQARGLGDAVLCAESAVGDEPFAVLLADDLIVSPGQSHVMKRLVECHRKHGATILSAEFIEAEKSRQYGVIDGEEIEKGLWRVTRMVEKPEPQDAPNRIGLMGRYILQPGIFECLRRTGEGAGGELQLTDAIAMLMQSEPVYAQLCEGTRYDCGSKAGYLQANVELGLEHPELGAWFGDYLRALVKERL